MSFQIHLGGPKQSKKFIIHTVSSIKRCMPSAHVVYLSCQIIVSFKMIYKEIAMFLYAQTLKIYMYIYI